MNTLHAPKGRPVTVFEKTYRPGQFMPFYVPRPHMPQIDEHDIPQLVHDTWEEKLNPTFRVVNPSSLHAHQRVDHAKAKSMAPEVRMKPILVSRDGFVLDGNHRWWSHVHEGVPYINVIELDVDFHDGIDYLLGRPYCYTIQPNTAERN